MKQQKLFFTLLLGCILSIFMLTESNAQWTQTNGPDGGIINCLAVGGSNIFAGINGGGVYLSTDSGASWTAVNTGLTNKIIKCIAVSGSNTFVGTTGGGIFLSTNNGTSWTEVNTGLPNTAINSLVVSGSYIFAGPTGGGVWKLPLSEIITVVEEINTKTPNTYILAQNYPNPFNPSTKIEYSIPEASFVQLKVYDILGNEVATLVNEEQSIGNYNIQFNAVSIPSGVYFYRIQSGSFVETNKMILLR